MLGVGSETYIITMNFPLGGKHHGEHHPVVRHHVPIEH